jgi:hypothetical protein
LLFYAVRGFVTLGQQVSAYFDGVAAVRHGADKAMSSVGSFVNEQILRQSKEAAPPTPPGPTASAPAAAPSAPAATPSPSPAAPSAAPAPATATAAPTPTPTPAPSATAPAPAASASAPPAPPSPSTAPVAPSAAPAGPAVSAPRRDARSESASKSAANCGAARQDCYPRCCRYAPPEDNRPRALEGPRSFEDVIPEGLRRNSRIAGPCIDGIGGCYWGGGRY